MIILRSLSQSKREKTMSDHTLVLPFGVREEIPAFKSSTDGGGTLISYIIDGGESIGIPYDQAWFWTPDWQAGERRVEEYIREGNIQSFGTMEEFLSSLDD